MPRFLIRFIVLGPAAVAILAVVAGSVAAQEEKPASSAPRWGAVRRVLEARCLRCHGGEQVKSGLRLATAETFARGGFRGPAVDREKPGSSRLLAVIGYANPELAMPPAGRLAADELDLLKRWVLAGAPWPEGAAGRLADPDRFADEPRIDARAGADWWAYRPLGAAAPPSSSDPRWNEHPVDAFIRAGLDRAGLEPAAPATPAALLRRASFDLLGLPPTPEEIARFREDVARNGLDEAWPRLVDRLLASPHHGEQMARHWLDLVRFAETNGYERDARKPNAWRYRDWVIRSFNADLPYDRFVIDQLAGDELAEWAPELLAQENDTGPVIATGYYRLGVWDDEPADAEQARADEMADIVDTTGQVFLGTTMGCCRCHDHKADPIGIRDYYALTAYFNNIEPYSGEADAVADPPREGRLSIRERDRLIAGVDHRLEPHLEALRRAVAAVPQGPPPPWLLRDARSEASTWRMKEGEAPAGWMRPAFDDTAWDEKTGGFGAPRTPGAVIGTEWRSSLIHLRTRFRLTEIPRSLVLTLHHDEDVRVHLNGRLVLERTGYRTDYTEIQLGAAAMDALVVGSNVLAVRCRNERGGQYVDAGLRTGWIGGDPSSERLRLEAEADRWVEPRRLGEVRSLLRRRREIAAMPTEEPFPAVVVSERGGRAPAQPVLHRGSAHAPGAIVGPAIPVVFRRGDASGPPLPAPDDEAATTGRRLSLARWVVGEGSFLSARVMANRLWQIHFGRGLCRSPGDFGRLGVRPTHPGLLDHLARELIDRGWSLKAMHRYIMASRTYRMGSAAPERALAADPRNDHLSHRDPRRLRAEEFYDAVLSACGDLNEKLLGPSVHPPLPDEVLATASRPDEAWGKTPDDAAWRRALYVFAKRSLRHPLLESLDQPDPDLPCPARFPTNVPTQALITLNGAFLHRAAGRLAARLAGEREDLPGRIERGLLLALGRRPSEGEVARHEAFVTDLRTRHGLDEREALLAFALALFNLNEFLWVD